MAGRNLMRLRRLRDNSIGAPIHVGSVMRRILSCAKRQLQVFFQILRVPSLQLQLVLGQTGTSLCGVWM